MVYYYITNIWGLKKSLDIAAETSHSCMNYSLLAIIY